MTKAIHSMIRVLDEQRSVRFYERALRLSIAERLRFEMFTLVYLCNPKADSEVEPTINKGWTEACDRGDGYGHIAFVVDDVDAEHARLTAAAGVTPRKLVDFAPGGEVIARFFFIADRTATRSRCCNAAEAIGKPGGDRARQPSQGGNAWTKTAEAA